MNGEPWHLGSGGGAAAGPPRHARASRDAAGEARVAQRERTALGAAALPDPPGGSHSPVAERRRGLARLFQVLVVTAVVAVAPLLMAATFLLVPITLVSSSPIASTAVLLWTGGGLLGVYALLTRGYTRRTPRRLLRRRQWMLAAGIVSGLVTGGGFAAGTYATLIEGDLAAAFFGGYTIVFAVLLAAGIRRWRQLNELAAGAAADSTVRARDPVPDLLLAVSIALALAAVGSTLITGAASLPA